APLPKSPTQQHLLLADPLWSPTLTACPEFCSVLDVSTIFFLMSAARLKKASSMFLLVFAETSRNGMPSSSARAWPCSVDTARFSSQSHLFPIRILLTPSVACCSTLANQVRISERLY